MRFESTEIDLNNPPPLPVIKGTKEERFLKVAKNVSEKYNLAKPTSYLDGGFYAKVYNTEDPNLVIRVARNEDSEECEKKINEKEIQETGGVVKVYYQYEEDYDEENYIISYKEKVDTNWLGYLKKQYSEISEEYKVLIDVIQWKLSSQSEFYAKQGLEILKKYKETDNLVNAVEAGISSDDLHKDNIGVNKSGNIVVIDC
jgi:hypothetical protein